jgi:adenylate cyclase
METVSEAITWFRENESALSGMAAMAMLVGVLFSLLRLRTRNLLGSLGATVRSEPAKEAEAPGSGPRTAKASVSIDEFVCTGGEQADSLGVAVRDATLEVLSNLTGLSVIGDATAADYVVSASIQTAAARYRTIVRLAERETGESFWSERFDGELTDHFEAQDELARRLSNALRFNLMERESNRAAQNESTDFEGLLSRAAFLLLRSDAEEWREVVPLLDEALRQRPDDFMANAMKAAAVMQEVMVGWRVMTPDAVEAAALHASQAVKLNDRSDYAHMVLGGVQLHGMRDIAAAKRECRRSLELNRYYNLGMWALGQCEICEGAYAEGALRCENAAEMARKFEINHRLLASAATGWFAAGDYERALETSQRSDERFPDVPRTLLVLCAAAMEVGREDLARNTAERIRTQHPTLLLSELGSWPFVDPAPWQLFVDALRRAGVRDA